MQRVNLSPFPHSLSISSQPGSNAPAGCDTLADDNIDVDNEDDDDNDYDNNDGDNKVDDGNNDMISLMTIITMIKMI